MKTIKLNLIIFLAFCLVVATSGAAYAAGSYQQATPTTSALAEVAKIFITELSTGDFEGASRRFDPAVAASASPSTLKEAWASLTGRAGAFKAITETVATTETNTPIVYVITELDNATVDIKVIFNQAGNIIGMFYTPSGTASALTQPYQPAPYVKPDSFSRQEITTGTSGWPLPGELILPEGAGPFPAVILIQGSGPNDRDETIGPNKPFRDLAEGLATQGIASLRYDKRTKAYASEMAGQISTLTVEGEVLDDAQAAIDLLRQNPAIDPGRIFVLGHSLGGMLAPRLATQEPQLAGVIILAGPTRPLEDIIVDQYSYLYALDGTTTPEEQAEIDRTKQAATRVKDPALSTDIPASELMGMPAAYWLDLRGYDPAQTAKQLEMPIFSLRGERDYQVTEADFAGWQSALEKEPDTILKQYPGLNHLLMVGQGPSTPDEYNRVGHVSKVVVDDIADFILTGEVASGTGLGGLPWSYAEVSRLVLLLIPIWLIQFGVGIFALLDLKKRKSVRGPRWLWAVLLIFFMFALPTGLIVSAIYLFWGRKDNEDDSDDPD